MDEFLKGKEGSIYIIIEKHIYYVVTIMVYSSVIVVSVLRRTKTIDLTRSKSLLLNQLYPKKKKKNERIYKTNKDF